jgi:hypothetical protein
MLNVAWVPSSCSHQLEHGMNDHPMLAGEIGWTARWPFSFESQHQPSSTTCSYLDSILLYA